MKHTAKFTLLTALACAAAQAPAFVVVDDNSELFVTATADIKFDDNIYLDASNEQDDVIYSLTPGLDYVFGKSSAAAGNVYFREEIRRYSDNDRQDTELANFGLNSKYDNGVTKFGFVANFSEVAQNDSDVNLVGSIARRDVTNVGGDVEFGFLEKTKLGIGLNYGKTDYDPAGYVDSAITTLPIDVYYAATPKLDWSFGYQYRQSNLSGASVDSKDHYFNLGARGEFTPKLTGQVRAGYAKRDFDVGSDDDLFGLSAQLAYAYSDKTSYQFNLGNDFGSSGTGASTKNFSWGVSGRSQLTDQWFVNAGLNWRRTEYPTVTDDYTEAMVAVAYKYNQWVDFSGSLTVRDNNAELAASEFSNTVFSFGANFRY